MRKQNKTISLNIAENWTDSGVVSATKKWGLIVKIYNRKLLKK